MSFPTSASVKHEFSRYDLIKLSFYVIFSQKNREILIAINTISDTPKLQVDFLLLQIADKIASSQLKDHPLIV